MAAGLFDTHLHFDDPSAAEADLAHAREAGVAGFMVVGGDLHSSMRAADLADRHPDVYAAAGVHPHEAAKAGDPETFAPLYARTRVAAVGEIGLSGELRSASQLERRLGEVARLGFKRCIIPKVGAKIPPQKDIEIIPAGSLREAINLGLMRNR